jgi:hypothetical protein
MTMLCRCGCEMQWIGGVAEWLCPHCDHDVADDDEDRWHRPGQRGRRAVELKGVDLELI